jgi:hypothetical protein
MSKQQPPTKEKHTNSTCRDSGHDWRTTAASNYRTCQRDNCKAAQRLENGQWTSVLRARPWTDPVAASQKRQAMPKQTVTVWDACTQQQGA